MSSRERDSGEPAQPLHRPVLLREVIRALDIQPGLTVVDGTVGAGGHSREILKQIGPEGRLIGFDRDPMMLRLAEQSLDDSRFTLHHANYVELQDILGQLNLPSADRVLLDLGLSSDQLADDERGFGFQSRGLLDLRFDVSQGEPAWKVIEESSADELAAIFRNWGEERFAEQIARRLIERKTTQPVRSAGDLSIAAAEALPPSARGSSRKNPATRVFQALRIAVNDELRHLDEFLQAVLPACISTGGVAVVISFHSLEDRLVKTAFRDAERWQNLTTKPMTPTATERKVNPRSRTAKLRAAKRV